MKLSFPAFCVASLLFVACETPVNTPDVTSSSKANANNMTFFLTSVGPGDGANLGGLAGADAHCSSLAAAAGSNRDWRAYLSTNGVDGVHAKDRIGDGPWTNANGVIVATRLSNLLDASANGLSKTGSVDENGVVINGRGDTPNRHDILTGTDGDGNATENTCSNWTNNGEGSATVGHHDRTGGGAEPTHWSSAHGSRGCSQSNLQSSGGDGLFYCFAVK